MTTVTTNDKGMRNPWGNLPTVRIRMVSNDAMSFGPTILNEGTEIELPTFVAGEFLARGSAVLVRNGVDKEVL
jgi:hypothetical protein